ncbi:MAG: SixA phosphatase family protein [Geminicoccaceae bacterium]
MLELLLLRHAKSRWDEPGTQDRERELAPRGELAAARMGRLIRERGLRPELVLCSTARRAVATWRLAAAELGEPPPLQYDDGLYLASPDRIVEVIAARGEGASRVLVVGHDPGMHKLAVRLAVTGEQTPRSTLAAKFPTAGLALIVFATDDWRQLSTQGGELRGFWRPRELGATLG